MISCSLSRRPLLALALLSTFSLSLSAAELYQSGDRSIRRQALGLALQAEPNLGLAVSSPSDSSDLSVAGAIQALERVQQEVTSKAEREAYELWMQALEDVGKKTRFGVPPSFHRSLLAIRSAAQKIANQALLGKNYDQALDLLGHARRSLAADQAAFEDPDQAFAASLRLARTSATGRKGLYSLFVFLEFTDQLSNGVDVPRNRFELQALSSMYRVFRYAGRQEDHLAAFEKGFASLEAGFEDLASYLEGMRSLVPLLTKADTAEKFALASLDPIRYGELEVPALQERALTGVWSRIRESGTPRRIWDAVFRELARPMASAQDYFRFAAARFEDGSPVFGYEALAGLARLCIYDRFASEAEERRLYQALDEIREASPRQYQAILLQAFDELKASR